MNIRMMTISVVFAVAGGLPPAIWAADEGDTWTNPLRNPDRDSSAESLLRPYPAQPPAATGTNPRSQPGWRNPGWFRPADAATAPSAERSPLGAAAAATPPGTDAGQPPAAVPPRNLIQRIRERRLAQLEKQAERLRQLSAGENRQGPSGRGSANPNGPENPDLQIDLGVPMDGPGAPTANPAPPDAPAISPGSSPGWTPSPPARTAASAPTELNPPAGSPLEVNIALPSDIAPPQPKPALQDRGRGWWPAPR